MNKSNIHEEALNYTINELKNNFINYIDEVWLYGSYARKKFRYNSDVDLFIVLNKNFINNNSNINIDKLKRKIKNETISENYKLPDIDIHFGYKSLNEYKDKNDYFDMSEYLFIKNIKKDGVRLI